MSEEVIEPSRAGAHEERRRGDGVIDSLRAPECAPARDLHETWREDATKTVGQLVAEGVERKEAARRVRWARRQARRMDEAVATLEGLVAQRAARRSARLSGAFVAPIPADIRRRGFEVEEDGAEGSR